MLHIGPLLTFQHRLGNDHDILLDGLEYVGKAGTIIFQIFMLHSKDPCRFVHGAFYGFHQLAQFIKCGPIGLLKVFALGLFR